MRLRPIGKLFALELTGERPDANLVSHQVLMKKILRTGDFQASHHVGATTPQRREHQVGSAGCCRSGGRRQTGGYGLPGML